MRFYHSGYFYGDDYYSIPGWNALYDVDARTTTIVSTAPDAKPEMPTCPGHGTNVDVALSNASHIAPFFCTNEDCETYWFTPNGNAKLADAALDSLPTGRYQTPVCKPYSTVWQEAASSFSGNNGGRHFIFDEVVHVTTATELELKLTEQVDMLQKGLLAENKSALNWRDKYYKANTDEAFRAEFARRFPSLAFEFIRTMSEIGDLGRAKHGENCIEAKAKRGDVARTGPFGNRIYSRTIAEHAYQHLNEYLDGVKHDVYKTRRHQLGAAAFNPMMEFLLAELEGEPCAPLEITNR